MARLRAVQGRPGAGLSIRRYLVLMLAAVAVPILLLAGLVSWRYAAAQRRHFEADVAAVAQVVLAVADREVLGMSETLRALATSPSLAQGDIAGFHRQIADLGRVLTGAIVLRDQEGRQIANSLIPWGSPLPQRSSLTAWDAVALRSDALVVSDHFVGITGGMHTFAILTRVPRDGAAPYLLHIGLPAARLQNALLQLGIDGERVGVVTDARGIVLARTRQHELAVGTPSTVAALLPERGATTRGQATDRDGREVFFVARSSPDTGLIAIGAAPVELLMAERRRALLVALGVGSLLLGLALLAARLFGRPLDLALRRLAEAGAALGRGEAVLEGPETIREIDEVRAALRRAAADLALHDAERSLMQRELDHRVKNLLATVLALAGLTAREGGDAELFRQRLSERLKGLARTQDLLLRAGSDAAGLEAVLRSELEMHDGKGGGRVRLSGPAVRLRSAQATAIGMIVHELATNAAKYGALGAPSGIVEVAWHVERAAIPRLHLRWTETGGPAVTPPTERGFGSRLIERGLARQLRATVATEYLASGLRFTLAMPLDAAVPQGG